jgi:DNA polymerase III delta prime subunit
MAEPRELLSELLRPQQLGDLTLPQSVIDRLQKMIETRSLMNMLFYGKPGAGKTSAARILINALGPEDSIEIDGSSATGVGYVRDHIQRFSSSLAMFGGTKICFIDETEYVSKSAQAALRKITEDYSDNVRFLIAVNDRLKIIPALRSRLVEICFDVAHADRVEVKSRLIKRYRSCLANNGIAFDEQRLDQLVGIYFPDLRAIANRIEFEFAC